MCQAYNQTDAQIKAQNRIEMSVWVMLKMRLRGNAA